jgi:hypothetical protein
MTQADKFTWTAAIAVVAIGIGVFGGIEVSKRAARAARAAAEPWRQLPGWRGTTITSIVSSPQPVIAAFKNDPPAPQERKAMFVSFLSGTDFFCIGWYGSIDAVTPNADGWEASVKIGCRLKSSRGGVPFCPEVTTETWQVSKSGAARCIRCDAGSPVDKRMLIVD